MILTIGLLVLGFILLIKGADLLVDGSSSVAKKFGVSDLIIGLTVVAFGTSAPELIVNIVSAVQGNSEIAIGNILGSNIANILLILGLTAIIVPLKVQRSTTWREIPFALLAVLMLGAMANDSLIDGAQSSFISAGDGIVLLGFFAVFMYYIFGSAKKNVQEHGDEDINTKKHSVIKSIVLIISGLAGLVVGGKWVVDSAIVLATSWGMSESVIGLTVVAVGTSLPELATSIAAALKGKADIAIGNVVGSNIFNIFWILGVTSLISPLPFLATSNIDILATILATILLFVWMFIGKKHHLKRWQGVVFVLLYVVYVTLLLTLR
ncbi:MAG: calcium/sodium antiporter [Candidatus Pacebacteria bacterium]|nr:calcium/sodium antiporter [Candidatus Paceibacterota bacterium]